MATRLLLRRDESLAARTVNAHTFFLLPLSYLVSAQLHRGQKRPLRPVRRLLCSSKLDNKGYTRTPLSSTHTPASDLRAASEHCVHILSLQNSCPKLSDEKRRAMRREFLQSDDSLGNQQWRVLSAQVRARTGKRWALGRGRSVSRSVLCICSRFVSQEDQRACA